MYAYFSFLVLYVKFLGDPADNWVTSSGKQVGAKSSVRAREDSASYLFLLSLRTLITMFAVAQIGRSATSTSSLTPKYEAPKIV